MNDRKYALSALVKKWAAGIAATIVLALVAVTDFIFGLPHEIVQAAPNVIVIGFILWIMGGLIRSRRYVAAAFGVVLIALNSVTLFL